MLNHRAIGKNCNPLTAVALPRRAEPVGVIAYLGVAFVGRRITHFVNPLVQFRPHHLLIRDRVPAGCVDHRIAQQILGYGVVASATDGDAIERQRYHERTVTPTLDQTR